MFHIRLRGDAEELLLARDRAAKETGVWLFGSLRKDGENHYRTELTMGESSLTLEDDAVAAAIAALFFELTG